MTPAAGTHSSVSPHAIAMPLRVDREWVSDTYRRLRIPSGGFVLDFTKTTQIDSAGSAFVHLLKSRCAQAGVAFEVSGAAPAVTAALSAWQGSQARGDTPAPAENAFARFGGAAVALRDQIVDALSVLTEMFYWGTLGLARKRDFRQGCLGEQMYQLGYKAILIVGMLSFLIGIVIALQSAIFLRTYGAGIFLASMIGWSMVKEFGPLLTAIILAGRSGSATTAEIATMGVNEEIDALKTMGISHYQFIIVPKFWAISITMPLLSMVASTAGILGGFLVSLLYLDLSGSLFWSELWKYISIRDVLSGLLKSLVFSWLIIWIGTYYGLRVRGGAEAVGRETTASVVTCIFVIILADAIFSFVL